MSGSPTTEPTERTYLAYNVTTLFKRWGLEDAEQTGLLGLSRRDKKQLDRFRKGEPLPEEPEILGRASALLAIHQQLADHYPADDPRVYTWMVTPEAGLEERRPVDLMLEEGVPGIRRVLQFLDSASG
ncbi:antitoxin Xre/MbcA/ParS toxin-binding domain-containing protein [Thiohalorhabdus sp. Cl-TMA]|uniref:Antitoxin Xre/MbcA/ParS toxin-binding domain-containing protein n=1 Tax=Thiohalorhabdus methylotrophus TaxID=3242694 RepID=A0ABV4TY20_9GAMM